MLGTSAQGRRPRVVNTQRLASGGGIRTDPESAVGLLPGEFGVLHSDSLIGVVIDKELPGDGSVLGCKCLEEWKLDDAVRAMIIPGVHKKNREASLGEARS